MSRVSKILTAGCTFSVALGTGFFVQNDDAVAGMVQQPVQNVDVNAEPVALRPIATTRVFALPDMPHGAAVTKAKAECTSDLAAVALPGALVALDLDAPCQPETRVSFHHQGLIFTAVTDAAGRLRTTVPALAVDAVFVAALPDGDGAVATTAVPDLAMHDRTVVQWQGDTALRLHALNDSGTEVGLGDPSMPQPRMATVHTGLAEDPWPIRIEADVTEANCGQFLRAQTLRVTAGVVMAGAAVDVTMPDCFAIGESVILDKLSGDRVLAAQDTLQQPF